MHRRDISEASKLETHLRRLERERWAIRHLGSMEFQVTQARGGISSDDPDEDDNCLPEWEAGMLRVSLSLEQMPPVRDALVLVYSQEIDRTKERLRKIGVDPEPDDL